MTNSETTTIRHLIERPDYRNSGNYQFVNGFTGGGNPMCVHLTPEEVSARCQEKLGPGRLVDDGTDLWWEQEDCSDTSHCIIIAKEK